MEVQQVINNFQSNYPSLPLSHFQLVLEEMSKGHQVTSRKNLNGHITISGLILNQKQEILHIKHKILQKWLLPGGHCEEEDSCLVDACLREIKEETNVSPLDLRLLQDNPINFDLHFIPENTDKCEPTHWHCDFRFAFQLLSSTPSIILQNQEVTSFKWIPLREMGARKMIDGLDVSLLQ
jgi:8-oxo-dGTP pyrophosphatase MutT (NUDIX family)